MPCFRRQSSVETGYFVLTMVRRQRVHTVLRTLRPFSHTVTLWRLGRKARGVDFFDQGRLRPKVVVLPQISHFAMIPILFAKITRQRAVPLARRGQSYHKPRPRATFWVKLGASKCRRSTFQDLTPPPPPTAASPSPPLPYRREGRGKAEAVLTKDSLRQGVGRDLAIR